MRSRGSTYRSLRTLLIFLALWYLGQDSEAAEVVIAAFVQPGAPSTVLLTDYGKRIEEDSGGSLTSKMMIHGEVGSEEQILSGMRRGRIQIGSLSTVVLSNVVREIGLIGTPFLFDNLSEFDYVLDTVLLDKFAILLEQENLVPIQWIDLGGVNIYSKSPILLPVDLTNFPMRATLDEGSRLFLEAVGADLIPLATPEALPALQTGLVKGGTTITVAYLGTGLIEEAPHLALTNHQFIGGMLVADKKWFDRLDLEDRVVVRSAIPDIDAVRQLFRGMVQDGLSKAEAFGFTPHHLTVEQREVWKASTRDTHQRMIEILGGDSLKIYEAIQNAKNSFMQFTAD